MLAQAFEDSKKMLAEGLKASTAEWHIIVTHFPAQILVADPFFEDLDKKYGIDLIVTGHTHYQIHGTDHGMPWIITGGGGGVTTDTVPSNNGHDQAYGFVDFAINRTSLKFDMPSWGGPSGDLI